MKYDEIKYLSSLIPLLVLITMKFFKQLRRKQLQLGLKGIIMSSYPYGQYKMPRFAHVLVEPKLNIFLKCLYQQGLIIMYSMTSWTSQAHAWFQNDMDIREDASLYLKLKAIMLCVYICQPLVVMLSIFL